MTVQLLTAADVRAYLTIDSESGRYAEPLIAANIIAATRMLQRITGRQWEPLTATYTFTSHGRVVVPIPDLRTATSVTLNGGALTANAGYWLIPSRQDAAIYTAIQLRGFTGRSGGDWYLGVPDWWDRGLDMPYGGPDAALPNDLVITGTWGHDPVPYDVLHAIKVLAAWYTKRPDSVLANISVTPEGAVMNYGAMPPEVADFVQEWRTGEMAVLA